MCGITGLWDISRESTFENLEAIAQKMSSTLLHRGPDDGGTWADAEAGIALGHRRLAIVDLSPEGHQPMVSGNGRYVIVFNGEIYNFLEIRLQLEQVGHRFRGYSDTEVMLAAFSQWGLESAVKRFNGMFAFALWDREERVLHLGRDRFGEKPLYYTWVGKTFLFGSELKALKAYPGFSPQIDRNALALYLRHNYIPAPYSIYQGVYKLTPASVLSVSPKNQAVAQPVSYWSVSSVAQSGIDTPFHGADAEAIEQLDTLLRKSVSLRMMADVPLGAFLSGGVDSSSVVALMQAQSSQPVKTFSIGFYEDSYNEAAYAKAVAQHLGTDHTEYYVTPKEAIEVIPKLPILYDEPFSDSSQIPTFLVSQLARKYVTVSLSGDAGDELFYGYERYFVGNNIWSKIAWLPFPIRTAMANSLRSLSPAMWNSTLGRFNALLPVKDKSSDIGHKIHTLANFLNLSDFEDFYKYLISHWKEAESLVWGAKELSTVFSDREFLSKLPPGSQRMMYLDSISYLPDDILVKLDRASMGASLEGRIPFLDPELVEFSWRIPLSMKIRHGQGKWLLRQVLYQYVPQNLIERPKMGFGVPIGDWLRGDLRDWAEELLDENKLRQEGFLNPQPIRQKWKEHLEGKRDWSGYIWDILMFQSWLEIK
ncbi:asparagine synthase (glutamine-hydrolyzing) [Laspinema sp. D1]|uniref:asparagine synthase (glutamine-hydrolyzing) n=1 Tax=Laspinema palackyanum TaxID=3231601 RepID=UPI00348F2B5F|nr:asparagine synthase (glutamine-hydrolyzing) [Laspinema sp. D2b]